MRALLLILLLFSAALPSLQAQTLLRWNFSPDRVLDYDITKKTVINTSGDLETNTESAGKITVGTFGESANVDFNLELVRSNVRGHEMEKEHLARLPGLSYKASLLPDGKLAPSLDDPPPNVQLMLDFSFPLPEKPLVPGETISQPMFMHAGRNLKDLRGEAVFTHKGYKVIDRATRYLRYQVECKLAPSKSDDNAEEDDQAPRTLLTASMECLFDEKKGQFYSVSSDMKMRMTVSPPGGGAKITMDQRHILDINLASDSLPSK